MGAVRRGMHIPFDDGLGIHPQDDFFLDREVWDLSRTPEELRPLLLHYHPLVIYRFQVLKQADVVLALFLHGDRFTTEEKRDDFEYYDPITTGDSTLSAVVQSIVAAEVGYHRWRYDYFLQALFVDLANLHDNTVDGLHVASTGGVWAALSTASAACATTAAGCGSTPGCPTAGSRSPTGSPGAAPGVRVTLTASELRLTSRHGELPVPIEVRGESYAVYPDEPVVAALDGHGPRRSGTLGNRPQTGGTRADGSRITSGVPDPMPAGDSDPPDPRWSTQLRAGNIGPSPPSPPPTDPAPALGSTAMSTAATATPSNTSAPGTHPGHDVPDLLVDPAGARVEVEHLEGDPPQPERSIPYAVARPTASVPSPRSRPCGPTSTPQVAGQRHRGPLR